MYVNATTFKVRPSSLLNIVDEWAAYALDAATALFGNVIESKLGETDDKGKPKYNLADILKKKTEEEVNKNVDAKLQALMEMGLYSPKKLDQLKRKNAKS